RPPRHEAARRDPRRDRERLRPARRRRPREDRARQARGPDRGAGRSAAGRHRAAARRVRDEGRRGREGTVTRRLLNVLVSIALVGLLAVCAYDGYLRAPSDQARTERGGRALEEYLVNRSIGRPAAPVFALICAWWFWRVRGRAR